MIECCIKCLGIIRKRSAGISITVEGEKKWACTDHEGCAGRQEKNKQSHRREIGGRVRRGRGRYTHLIVILDKFGAIYGYGNFYVDVVPDQTTDQALEEFLASRNYTMDDLAVEKIVSIPSEPEFGVRVKTSIEFTHDRAEVPDGICGRTRGCSPLGADWPCVRDADHSDHHQNQFGHGWDEFGTLKLEDAP